MLARGSMGIVARGSSHSIFPLPFTPTLVLSGVPTAPAGWKRGVCSCVCSDPQGREKAEGRSGPLWRAQSCRQAAEPFTVRGLALAYRPIYPKGGTEEALGLWLQYFPSHENHPTLCAEQREENERINWWVVLPTALCSQNPSRKLYLSLQVMICHKDLSVLNMSSKHGSFFIFSECKTIRGHHKSLKNRWATRRKWEADCPACHSTQPVSHLDTNLVVFVMRTHFLFVCLVKFTLWIVLQHIFHLMFLKHLHIFSNLSFAAEQTTSKFEGLR